MTFFFIDLTKYGSHVYVLVRRGELRASKIMAKRLQNNPKIVRPFSIFLKSAGLKNMLDYPLEYHCYGVSGRRRPLEQPPHQEPRYR